MDAAKDNYAGAAYLRSENDGLVKTNLIFSRNRVVAKAENITIPRKELMAMILGVRIMKFVKNELRKSIDDYYIWGDSKTVLYWIKSDSDETKPRFIANRLQEIKRYIECTFGYVKSAENSADIMTRGMKVQELKESQLWWTGPEWLKLESAHWPKELVLNISDKGEETVLESNVNMAQSKEKLSKISWEKYLILKNIPRLLLNIPNGQA